MENHSMGTSEESLSLIMMKLLDGCFDKKRKTNAPRKIRLTKDKPIPDLISQTIEPEEPVSLDKELDKQNSSQLLKHEIFTPSGEDQNRPVDELINPIEDDNFNLFKNNPLSFKSLETILCIKHLHSQNDVWSPLELKDKRIATGGSDGSISICSIDYENKTYTVDIKHENAHFNSVISLCELDDGKLVSASYDMTIKVWSINENNLELIKTIEGKNMISPIWKVIKLTNNRFASCSTDGIIKVFNSETYEKITSMKCSSSVYSILQLTNKEILVSTCGNRVLYFWDLTTYKRKASIKGINVVESSHMIELQNGFLALSTYSENYPIIIVDPNNYEIVKEIKNMEFIKSNSSLCTYDDHSFIYAKGGFFVQFSSTDYEILYASKTEQNLDGYGGITVANGKYLIIPNNEQGVNILNPL